MHGNFAGKGAITRVSLSILHACARPLENTYCPHDVSEPTLSGCYVVLA